MGLSTDSLHWQYSRGCRRSSFKWCFCHDYAWIGEYRTRQFAWLSYFPFLPPQSIFSIHFLEHGWQRWGINSLQQYSEIMLPQRELVMANILQCLQINHLVSYWSCLLSFKGLWAIAAWGLWTATCLNKQVDLQRHIKIESSRYHNCLIAKMKMEKGNQTLNMSIEYIKKKLSEQL